MPQTVADYVRHMKHAIGGDPDTRVVPLQVLNEACRYLFDQHPWTFRERPILTVTTTISQNYITLPADFGEIMSVHSGTRFVELTSKEDVAHRRNNTLSPPPVSAIYVALSFPGQTDQTGLQPVPRLEIFPDVISVYDIDLEYRAGAIALAVDADVPNIPPSYERALTLLARAFIQDYEEQDSTSEWEKVKEEIEALKQKDALSQANLGLIRGGAVGEGRKRVNFFVGTLNAR